MSPTDAFIEQLVLEHGAYLLRIAQSIVHDKVIAEDVVQEVFVTALMQHHKLYAQSNYRAWLTRITINRCRDQLRRQKVRQRWGQAWFVVRRLLGESAEKRPIEFSAERNAINAELWRAIDKLPEKYQLPLILRYVHSLKAKDIAAILEIKEGTVYSRLHTALRQLSVELAEPLQQEFLR